MLAQPIPRAWLASIALAAASCGSGTGLIGVDLSSGAADGGTDASLDERAGADAVVRMDAGSEEPAARGTDARADACSERRDGIVELVSGHGRRAAPGGPMALDDDNV